MTARPLVLGHRGASRRAPENTLEAFSWARSVGADGVELDARRTADGVAVVHHDPQVEGYGLLRARPFADLRAALPQVPTLDEALDALTGLVVNIEMKCLPWEPDPDPDGELAALVVQAMAGRDGGQGGHDRFVVSSFDLGALGAVRALDARLPAGWLTHRQPVEQTAPIAVERGLAWLHPDRTALVIDPNGACRLAHDLGLRVTVWTVNEPAEIRAFADAGVDALITDVPDVARAALDEAR